MSSIYDYISYNSYSNYNLFTNYGASSYNNINISGRNSESYYRTKTINEQKAGATSATQAYEVKAMGEELSDLLSKISSNKSESKYGAKSSNTDLVTFDNTNTSATATTSGFTLQIDQIAKAQVNSGNAVNSTSKSVTSSTSGNPYKFDIEIGGKKHSFSIAVNSTDNNKSIQTKMAQAINNASIGVTAAVESGNGKSTLSVTSKNTGTDRSSTFTVTDTNGSIAKSMGITNVSQEAQDAKYRIGNASGTSFGATVTSSTNTITIANGTKATLRGSSGTTVSAAYELGTAANVDAVKSFISSLNDALSTASSGSGRGDTRLSNDITGMNKAYSASLARVGLNVNSDGSISIDEKKLNEAAENGKLQKLFQDDLGFAKRVSTITRNMEQGNFYSNPSSQYNYSNGSYYNPYANSSYLLDIMF